MVPVQKALLRTAEVLLQGRRRSLAASSCWASCCCCCCLPWDSSVAGG